MKVLTVGWISVFILIFLMNLYIWKSYWAIPFMSARLIKVSTYLVIQVFLIGITLYYFYLFFNGKAETKRATNISYLAGFYITLLHYSLLFYLIHDLIYITNTWVAYPLKIRIYSGKLFFGGFIIFLIASLISLYGISNGKKLLTKTYVVELDQKQSEIDTLTVAFVSDAHIGTSLNLDNLDDLIAKINAMDADILLLGGDFYDEGTSQETKYIVAQKLAAIKTKYGSFAIEGNHEYKSGNEDIDEEMDYFENEGIKTLQDESILIDDAFYLVGRKDSEGETQSLSQLMAQVDKSLPVILLDHRPGFKESAQNEKVSLQLSGHTHSGQFFPMKYIEPLSAQFFKQYIYGYHKVNGLHHIVSSGAGNWGIPVRLGSKREILKIELRFK